MSSCRLLAFLPCQIPENDFSGTQKGNGFRGMHVQKTVTRLNIWFTVEFKKMKETSDLQFSSVSDFVLLVSDAVLRPVLNVENRPQGSMRCTFGGRTFPTSSWLLCLRIQSLKVTLHGTQTDLVDTPWWQIHLSAMPITRKMSSVSLFPNPKQPPPAPLVSLKP